MIRLHHGQTELAQWTAQRIKEIISLHRDDAHTILDVGCGDGDTAYVLQDIMWQTSVTGVDSSAPVIARDRERYPHITFFECDDRSLPFESGNFDCVYSSYVFHHLNFDQQKKMMSEIMRVLRPAGLAIIFEFNRWHLPTRYHFMRNPTEKDAKLFSFAHCKKLAAPFGKPIGRYYSSLPFLSPVYSVVVKR